MSEILGRFELKLGLSNTEFQTKFVLSKKYAHLVNCVVVNSYMSRIEKCKRKHIFNLKRLII
jgi:hypothetical protein